MKRSNKAGVAAALAAAALLAPTVGSAQSAPAAWSSKEGRWDAWKEGTFATSQAHFNALKAAAKGGAKLTWQTLPDWSGIWTAAMYGPGAPAGWGTPRYRLSAAGGIELNPAGPFGGPPPPPTAARPERPVLTPAYEKKLQEELARNARGIEWDYLSYCLPAGFPRWHTEPFLKEYVVTPNQSWLINEMQSEVRRVYTDGRDHVPEDARYPTWEGDSVGFWDGDTLVIHTISLKPGTWNRSQPEDSDKVETVELMKKNAQGLLETRMTVYDPETLQKPWHVLFGTRRDTLSERQGVRIDMWSCNENNNVSKTADGGTTLLLPGQEGYKDPNALQRPPGT